MITWKFCLGIVNLSIITYLLLCISLRTWQNRLIFVPSSIIETNPEDLSLAYEEVWLTANNRGESERIHGWWIPNAKSDSPALLYLHGNGINIGANLRHAQRFQQLGFSVLLIDYRGYGRSEGNFPSESQVYQDAQIAWDYLLKHKEIEPENIFLYGHSLGGAIAIDLATRNPKAAGLIVESSFTSMRQMADLNPIYRLLPLDLIVTQKFDSIAKIPQLRLPLLLIHGSEDALVPASMSQTLFATATSSKKSLVIIPDAEHNNVASVGGDRYLQAVRDFYKLASGDRHHLSKS